MVKRFYTIILLSFMFLNCSDDTSPNQQEVISCNWFLDSSTNIYEYYYVNSLPEDAPSYSIKHKCYRIHLYPESEKIIFTYLITTEVGSYTTTEELELPSSYSYEEL